MLTADERFQHAVSVVLQHEGGLVDHPSDPGGITQWGISLRFLRRLGHDVGDVDDDGDVDADDVRRLPKQQAIAIYRAEWWDRYRYGEIQHLATATKVFDLSVNMGPRAAHRRLQRALHACGRRRIKVDGILGPKTLKAVNEVRPHAMLLAALRVEASYYYRMLIRENPELAQFERGWLNRALA